MSGQIYVCKEIKENLSQLMLAEEDNFGINKLTEREIEVLKFIKDGLSSKEIADKLFVSYRTIEVHRSHLVNCLARIRRAQDGSKERVTYGIRAASLNSFSRLAKTHASLSIR